MGLTGSEGIFSGTKSVEPMHRFDEDALANWMSSNIAGFIGPLGVSQFKGGQSNPTYRLDTPSRSYVLRRKPVGKLLASAHAVDREYRVISSLHTAGFPVATPFGLCSDETVLGTIFYIMSMEVGRVFWDGSLPNLSKLERTTVYQSNSDPSENSPARPYENWPRRLWTSWKLLCPPSRPLDQAIPGIRNAAYRPYGEAYRMASQNYPSTGACFGCPWRLSSEQRDVLSCRFARSCGA